MGDGGAQCPLAHSGPTSGSFAKPEATGPRIASRKSGTKKKATDNTKSRRVIMEVLFTPTSLAGPKGLNSRKFTIRLLATSAGISVTNSGSQHFRLERL